MSWPPDPNHTLHFAPYPMEGVETAEGKNSIHDFFAGQNKSVIPFDLSMNFRIGFHTHNSLHW